MKLNILILLLFFTIFQSKADQIYELIKIPNLKIYKIDKENNLRYLTPKKDFVTNSGTVSYTHLTLPTMLMV